MLVLVCVSLCECACVCACVYITKICVHMERRVNLLDICFSCPEVIEVSCVYLNICVFPVHVRTQTRIKPPFPYAHTSW